MATLRHWEVGKLLKNLIVSGDSKIGGALQKRLDAAATTRRREDDPTRNPDLIYFDLRSSASLPEAQTTYFCSGINGFMACEQNANEAHTINVKGTVQAASFQVQHGGRVILLSSCAAETHKGTIYGDFKFLTEQRFISEFGDHASVFRFGPVKFPGRNTYPNGIYQPIEIEDLIDVLTSPFVPGLHRIISANRWEDVA